MITHALSGAALGGILAGFGLLLVVPAALVLHLLLDAIPHWDYTRSRHALAAAVIDVTSSMAVLIAVRVLFDGGWVIVIAGLVSALPDLDVFNAILFPDRRVRVFPSHWPGFPHGSAAPLPGIATQAAVAALSLAVLGARL